MQVIILRYVLVVEIISEEHYFFRGIIVNVNIKMYKSDKIKCGTLYN